MCQGCIFIKTNFLLYLAKKHKNIFLKVDIHFKKIPKIQIHRTTSTKFVQLERVLDIEKGMYFWHVNEIIIWI